MPKTYPLVFVKLALVLPALILLMLFPFSVTAARLYQVEVLVFSHDDPALSGGEDWSVPEAVPNYSTAVELVDGDESGSGFQALPATALNLAAVYQRLRASASYRPVIHKSWIQAGYGANSVRRVYLTNRSEQQDSTIDSDLLAHEDSLVIEGTVGLQGGRLLHLGANFTYRDAEISTNLRQFRQIKLKEIHYFDHPLFGVLVQVTPYRVAPEEN